jgi:hypothetical protein
MKYKVLNNITGWIAFLIAAITYLLTIEPTASFWDCGEFITIAYKLEVGHPPGAPFFMLLGRMFTLFAGPQTAALMMNIFSALASAFTILFLFWTVTHLTKRLVNKADEPTMGETIAILGSGLVGALAYTFSDTFWFSAVEAEVYATSSLFTAVVFWAILKWEDVANEPGANRWIILICYLAGLSIGVHLLNLLVIPAIAFIYYYKKYPVTRKGIGAALLISGVILGFILYGIIPGAIKVATWFELLFSNVFGLPFNTGFLFYIALLIALLSYGVYYTHKNHHHLWNTVILGVAVILIGYGSYALIPIRSAANPPMDQNSPDNVFSMLSFLNREQYGSRPLVYGEYFNTPLNADEPYVHDKDEYIQKNGRYVVSYVRQKPNYADEFCTVFPRMWSRNDSRHVEAYKQWGNVKGTRMTHRSGRGETQTIMKPTFGENLRFFFNYQVNFMYFRYFMWNFAGRQNDIQGHGNAVDGNWISGIKFIDQARLGNQDDLPSKYADNPGRNVYFFLPLILGILGIFFQLGSGTQGKRDLWVVSLLFILTGLAIVVYLNQNPYQPRERDYAYAGSFYAFTIWIGMGVAYLYQKLKKFAPEHIVAGGVTALSLLAVPALMAAQNYDDHTRAGRTSATDFGRNYLQCVEPQGVIFTNGDNDTYPLWYNQEVEGFGTDLRVCNLSYFQTDWYVEQMQRKAYESKPLPISFTKDQYVQGTRDVVWLMDDPRFEQGLELKRALDFIKSDDPSAKISYMDNASFLPTRTLYLKIDKEAVIRHKVVAPEEYSQIVDTMVIRLSGQYITKDQLMLLDMLQNNNWERPLYFAISVGAEKYMGLDSYFRLEGLTYRIVPVKSITDDFQKGYVDLDRTYNNMIEKFAWGNLKAPGVYADENNRRMCSNLRNNLQRLAENLLWAGRNDSALKVLDLCMEELPVSKIPYDYFVSQIARLYIEAGNKEKGMALMKDMYEEMDRELNYYFGFKPAYYRQLNTEIRSSLFYMSELLTLAKNYADESYVAQIEPRFNKHYELFLQYFRPQQ